MLTKKLFNWWKLFQLLIYVIKYVTNQHHHQHNHQHCYQLHASSTKVFTDRQPPAPKPTIQTACNSNCDKKVSSDSDSSWNNAGVQAVFYTHTWYVAFAISKFLCHIASVDVEEFGTLLLQLICVTMPPRWVIYALVRTFQVANIENQYQYQHQRRPSTWQQLLQLIN